MDAVDAPMSRSAGTGADHITITGEAGLQQAYAPYLEFQGLSARECEAFIAAVSRRAFTEGKEYDDRWTAAFASSCFAYDALRWWNGLDEKVQGSWKLLRSAMLSSYPSMTREATGENVAKDDAPLGQAT
ncbi:hypothetical protein FRC04_001635 [Tulasnella sp. 424]|nr:hypothetical protein FRC04_001635 [Tulasnella sp. 424]KAG8968662.1 hypothetical protein FRC05_001468 [Tulasnella sp. 425]